MRSSLCILLALLVLTQAGTTPSWIYDAFDHWCTKYEKTYDSPTERTYRVNIFYDNLMYIHSSNSNTNSYTLGLNQFSDLTKAEFKEMYLGAVPPTSVPTSTFTYDMTAVPASIDWVTKGAVTPIKNQGQCGSCWAFSTTGALEGVYQINTGTLASYSEQQLVDCSEEYGNYGCDGGWPYQAMEYVEASGIETEANYPYVGVNQNCAYVASDAAFKITGYTSVPASNNDALQAANAMSPVSICLDAENIMSYSSGIYDGPCGTSIDHCVLLVGYGTTNGTDYWTVKNSWGTTWGEEGYFQLIRKTGTGTAICGMNLYPTVPTY